MNTTEIAAILKDAETLAKSVSSQFQPAAFECAVELLQGRPEAQKELLHTAVEKAPTGKTDANPKGTKGRIQMLIDKNFFAQKRGLSEVLAALSEMGFTYTQPDISTPLVRFCKNRQLRRLKEEGNWKYVNN